MVMPIQNVATRDAYLALRMIIEFALAVAARERVSVGDATTEVVTFYRHV